MTQTTQSESNYRAIFYVYLGIVLASFLPYLLAVDIWQLPVIVVTALGLVHFLLLAYLYDYLIQHRQEAYLPHYFLAQFALVAAILWLSQGDGSTFWLLLLPLAGQSVNLPRWATVLVCLLLLLLFGGAMVYWWGATWTQVWEASISLSTAVLFVVVFTFVANREWEARLEVERLAGELQEANQQLRHYAAQVEEMATLQERNRIAREIHDSLGHYLTTINMQLNAAQAILGPETADSARARDMLTKAQRLTQEGLQEVRHSVAALRQSSLAKRPFIQNLDDLLAETRRAGLIVERHTIGLTRPLVAKVENSLYRAVQEGLTNTRKYGRASRIDVTLDYSLFHQIHLIIRDNGVGAEPAQADNGGFGLLGLRERVQLLGGQMQIETAPQAGFTLSITIPTPPDQDNP